MSHTRKDNDPDDTVEPWGPPCSRFEDLLYDVPSGVIVYAPQPSADDPSDFEATWVNEAGRRCLRHHWQHFSLRSFPVLGDTLVTQACAAWCSGVPSRFRIDQVEYQDPFLADLVLDVIFYREGDHLVQILEDRTIEFRADAEQVQLSRRLLARHAATLDLLAEGVVVFSPAMSDGVVTDLVYEYVNAAAARIRGVSSGQDLVGVHLSSQELPLGLLAVAQQVWRTSSPARLDDVLLTPLGWMGCDAVLQRLVDNLVLILGDHRAHRRTVEALTDRVNLYQSVASASPMMVGVYEPVHNDSGTIVDLRVLYASPPLQLSDPRGYPAAGESLAARYGADAPLIAMAETARATGREQVAELPWDDGVVQGIFRLRVAWQGSWILSDSLDVTEMVTTQRHADTQALSFSQLCERIPLGLLTLEPLYDEHGELCDLEIVDLNAVARHGGGVLALGLYRLEVGDRASAVYVDPHLALDAARAVLAGSEGCSYEVDIVSAAGSHRRTIHTFAAGGKLLQAILECATDQTVSDRTFVAVLDAVPTPAHLHRPVFKGDRMVDTEVVFANVAASRTYPVPQDGAILASNLVPVASPAALRAYHEAWDHPGKSAVASDRIVLGDGVDLRFEFHVTRIGDLLLSLGEDVTESEVMRQDLAESELRYHQTLESLALPVMVVTPLFDQSGIIIDAQLVYANPAERARSPFAVPGALSSRRYEDFPTVGLPLLREAWSRDGELVTHLMEPDGVRSNLLVFSARRTGDRILGFVQDLTEIELARSRARRSEEMLHGALSALSIPVAELLPADDGGFTLGYTNAAASRFDLADLQAWVTKDFLAAWERDDEYVTELRVNECVYELHLRRVGDSVLAWAHDLTSTNRQVADLEHAAYTDSVTNLGNTRALDRTLTDIMEGKTPGSLGLVLFDITNFDEVQRSLGFEHIEEFLATAGRALRRALVFPDGPEIVLLARSFASEFVLVVRGIDEPERFLRTVETACVNLSRQSFLLGDVPVFFSVSAGAAFSPLHATSPAGLTQAARDAAWSARQRRAPLGVWSPEIRTAHTTHRSLLTSLEAALGADELFLEFHPRFSLTTGALVGLEAQTRWRANTSTAVSQGFLEALTNSVLSPAYTHWLLDALVFAAQTLYPELAVPISADLPPGSLHGGLIDEVSCALIKCGVPAPALGLEITSHDPGLQGSEVRNTLNSLHSLGVHLILDDFGTGHTNLGHLRRLPVHEVKLDRTFARRLDSDAVSRTVVQGSVAVVEALGMVSAIEGIERAAEARVAAEIGCQVGQGFVFSRPLPAERLLDLFRSGALVGELSDQADD
jgi:EAL domain-containing protein (putative c-di-GMP-specific phosphodiesterase class I)/GGDEF domain-containing protein